MYIPIYVMSYDFCAQVLRVARPALECRAGALAARPSRVQGLGFRVFRV